MPFLPVKGFFGSDYLRVRPDFKTVKDPFQGGEVVVVPPINPDLCFLHGFCADQSGDVLMDRSSDSDLAAKGAKLTVVSVEERVENLDQARGPAMKRLSGLHVDYLVLAPGGAAPTSCPERYGLDLGYLQGYLRAFQEDRLEAWLEEEMEPGGEP